MELGESASYAASVWHTDMTFLPDPAAFAILRPIELPAVGGDTMWANAANAYRRLPEPLKPLADNLWSIHSSDFDFEGSFDEAYKARMDDYSANTKKHPVQTEHPVVQVHPETGERSLILGSWVKRFVGLNNSDWPRSSRSCSPMCRTLKIRSAGIGGWAMSPCGTTAQRNTVQCRITAMRRASCAGRQCSEPCRRR